MMNRRHALAAVVGAVVAPISKAAPAVPAGLPVGEWMHVSVRGGGGQSTVTQVATQSGQSFTYDGDVLWLLNWDDDGAMLIDETPLSAELRLKLD